MKTHTVILLDKSSDRRRKMGIAFRGIAKIYWYDCQAKQVKKERENQRGKFDKSNDTSFDLLLIHAREKDLYRAVQSDYQIWYGGNGAYDSDIPQGALRIFRPIASSQFLTAKEAGEILQNMQQGIIEHSSTLMNPSYNLRQLSKADFYEKLTDPEEVDWGNIQLPLVFKGHAKDWKTFKTKVMQLLQQKHQQNDKLSPFDNNYTKLLEAFINST